MNLYKKYLDQKTRQGRFRVHAILFTIAFGPGAVAIWIWQDSIFLVLIISWITWWGTHLAGMAAETKTEVHDE